jgi:hypothetical protein
MNGLAPLFLSKLVIFLGYDEGLFGVVIILLYGYVFWLHERSGVWNLFNHV